MVEKKDDNEYKIFYMLIGLSLGISLGAACENVNSYMAIGMLLGAIVDWLIYSNKNKQKK